MENLIFINFASFLDNTKWRTTLRATDKDIVKRFSEYDRKSSGALKVVSDVTGERKCLKNNHT